ncbi:hypothetical protein KXV92_004427 [Aspergillus fumigatus]|nr:hypothetical protein KXX42_001387 [Aspergillus fumigatus]KAH1556693.1 hypothetical protein KXX57_000209 [Aspergillus fumigatus]KAH1981217.1 hypothetical protein KXW88_006082 [Aspergillus fumigatus]KAH3212272.1 hypothetical protein KXV92_004427 [Aspergillus fumigatus]
MNDTATLHLPRLLCLHGGGTNARIFRMQCRVLEKHLGRTFRLVYAQGPFTVVQPGPDVTSVYKDYGPFRSWLRDSQGHGRCHRRIGCHIACRSLLLQTAPTQMQMTMDRTYLY